MWLRRACAGLAAVCVAGCGGQTPSSSALTVGAAVSLTEPLTGIARAWRDETGTDVTFNFAGSNTLARQILQGAPVDVFVSADARQMDRVQEGGALVPETRTPIARNRLVVVVPAGAAAPWRDAIPLASDKIATIAIGDPDAVPAGVYARAWLERIGLWEQVRDRIVPTANVRAALTAVDSGAADAAVVYRTDTGRDGRRSVVYEVPASESPEIVYYAAVLEGARNLPAARAFVSFLAGETASRILSRHGFARVR